MTERPSGVKSGLSSAAGFGVSFFRSPPVAGASHTSVFVLHASTSRPSRFDTTATCRLSAEKAMPPSS